MRLYYRSLVVEYRKRVSQVTFKPSIAPTVSRGERRTDGTEVSRQLGHRHYKGMAIVENEFGTLFYIEDMDEGMAPAGTVVEDGLMESIQNLRKVDRDAILRAFGGREE